jgi:hypothetical protein
MPKRNAKIQEIRGMLGSIGKEKIEGIAPKPLRELRELYETLPDKRYAPFVEHKLADIVMITLLAGKSGRG